MHAHTHYAQTTAIPILFSPSSYQLCEYVTASHNETLSDTARARTFLIKRQLSFPYHGEGGVKGHFSSAEAELKPPLHLH